MPVKTPRQQGLEGLHRVREQRKAQRVTAINLVRGLLREFGIVIRMGVANKLARRLLAIDHHGTGLIHDTLA